jgi:hypothetical protein
VPQRRTRLTSIARRRAAPACDAHAARGQAHGSLCIAPKCSPSNESGRSDQKRRAAQSCARCASRTPRLTPAWLLHSTGTSTPTVVSAAPEPQGSRGPSLTARRTPRHLRLDSRQRVVARAARLERAAHDPEHARQRQEVRAPCAIGGHTLQRADADAERRKELPPDNDRYVKRAPLSREWASIVRDDARADTRLSLLSQGHSLG